jgi:hypothetical protein
MLISRLDLGYHGFDTKLREKEKVMIKQFHELCSKVFQLPVKGNIAYARSYAMAGLGLGDIESVKCQALYIACNLPKGTLRNEFQAIARD